MKVFISGASGLVGSNCFRYFQEQNMEVVGSHFSFPVQGTVFFDALNTGDSRSFDLMKWNPDVIIHCGALTHVDYCENNQEESFEKTVLSTQHLLSLAKNCQAKFVFISTDYVFDGVKGPYLENEKPNPINIYGIHKAKAEKLVLKTDEKNLVIRITNVYGEEERGKNFISRIIKQCIAHEVLNLKLPVDQYATPTNALDIAKALFLLIRDNKKGIYHLAGSDFMNRVTLAKKVLQYFPNAHYELQTFTTSQLNQDAQRPLFGGLIPYRFLSEYPDFLFGSVDNYMTEKVVQYH